MLRGLYTAAAGMLANTTATDTMANNVANVNTAGFKRSTVSFQAFPEMLMHRIQGESGGSPSIGSMMSGTIVHGQNIDYSQGSLHRTGNPLDVAIQGDGFFKLETANGKTRYTRDGSFTLNEQGELITQNGDKVLGTSGPIQIPAGSAVEIGPDGIINAIGAGSSQAVGQLEVTQFEGNQGLVKVGSNQYEASDSAKERSEPSNFRIAPGSLEGSNVNIVSELVNSITGMRLYEALEKNIHAHNETLGKAVNEVGKYK